MTLSVQHTGRKADAPPVVTLRTLDDFRNHPRPLPSWSDEDAWSAPDLFCRIARVRPCQTPAELVETYGSADPVWLRARFALPADVAAAEQFAAEAQAGREVAA